METFDTAILSRCIGGGLNMVNSMQITILFRGIGHEFAIIGDEYMEDVAGLNCNGLVPSLE